MGISTMNNVIRDNRKLLKRRNKDKFVHIPGKFGEVKKEKYDHVVLKPQVLKEIRKRLTRERKELIKKRMIAFVITLVLLLGLLLL